MLVADIAEQPWKFSFVRRENDLRIVRSLDRFEQMIRRFGKACQRIRIQHQISLRRQRGVDEIALCPEPYKLSARQPFETAQKSNYGR